MLQTLQCWLFGHHYGNGQCRVCGKPWPLPPAWLTEALNQQKRKPLREATMPVYDYVCKDCQNAFEVILALGEHDKGDIPCPKCGSKNVEQAAVAFFAVTSKKS